MAIQIADGFQLRVAKPLDDRQNVETVAQLDPTYGYEGQIVYVKDIKRFYTCYKDENGSLAYKVMETGSSTPNESAGIELWVSGKSYEENDFVSYNDYIYRCKIANNDTDFVEDNWQKQSDTHVEITEQEILDLLDLTDEELETMAHLIDDSAISLNKTYSSSKIYTDIRQCLQDSKDFTLEELGKKIGASYEVVTSIDDMVSQDRLYLLNNGNNYDIYIVDADNVPVVIGDTSIDFSGFVTITEIESELGTERLGTTSQTVKGAINELFQSVTNEGDITDLENRITTNETNITDLQEQTSDLQEQIDNLDIPDITDLENASIMYCDVAEINKAKGTNISLVAGEDNTEKIMNVLAPHEVFAGWFMNENIYNRFGIDLSMGDRLNFVSIQKYPNKEGAVIAITNKGKVLSRYVRNKILSNWEYDTTDLTGINTKLSQLETKANLIPVVADNPTTSYDLNDYIENANYSIGGSSNYSNRPISRPGLLTVIRSNSYRLQIYTVVNNDDVYFRKSINGGDSWSSWVLLNNSADLTDINDRLTQLENTTSGGNTNNDVYSTVEQAVGTWINGQTLYRRTISDRTERNPSNGTLSTSILALKTPYKCEVVKLEGVARITSKSSTTGDYSVTILPYYEPTNSMRIYLSYTSSSGNIGLTCTKMTEYKLLGLDVSIYYYKK